MKKDTSRAVSPQGRPWSLVAPSTCSGPPPPRRPTPIHRRRGRCSSRWTKSCKSPRRRPPPPRALPPPLAPRRLGSRRAAGEAPTAQCRPVSPVRSTSVRSISTFRLHRKSKERDGSDLSAMQMLRSQLLLAVKKRK